MYCDKTDNLSIARALSLSGVQQKILHVFFIFVAKAALSRRSFEIICTMFFRTIR